jgi:hypothetical protein
MVILTGILQELIKIHINCRWTGNQDEIISIFIKFCRILQKIFNETGSGDFGDMLTKLYEHVILV